MEQNNKKTIDEALANVMYQIGRSNNPFLHGCDIDELVQIAESITNDWSEMKDIRSLDEEGYVGKYAERRLSEMKENPLKDKTVWRLTEEDFSAYILPKLAEENGITQDEVLARPELMKKHDHIIQHAHSVFSIHDWSEHVLEFISDVSTIMDNNAKGGI